MKTFSFKYKNDKLFNIISFIFFIFFILLLIIILGSNNSILTKILFILLAFIGINLFLILISRVICISVGIISFDKHSFIYETINSEYTINYQEIEYINKNNYIDNDSIIRNESYLYKVKIKNAGYFIFKKYDDSIDDAIIELSKKSDIKIDE